MILYDVHITVSLGRGLHLASTLQERSRKESGKNFLLMFCDDGDVVNFPMHWYEKSLYQDPIHWSWLIPRILNFSVVPRLSWRWELLASLCPAMFLNKNSSSLSFEFRHSSTSFFHCSCRTVESIIPLNFFTFALSRYFSERNSLNISVWLQPSESNVCQKQKPEEYKGKEEQQEEKAIIKEHAGRAQFPRAQNQKIYKRRKVRQSNAGWYSNLLSSCSRISWYATSAFCIHLNDPPLTGMNKSTVAEVRELAGNCAKDKKKKTIVPRDVMIGLLYPINHPFSLFLAFEIPYKLVYWSIQRSEWMTNSADCAKTWHSRMQVLRARLIPLCSRMWRRYGICCCLCTSVKFRVMFVDLDLNSEHRLFVLHCIQQKYKKKKKASTSDESGGDESQRFWYRYWWYLMARSIVNV